MQGVAAKNDASYDLSRARASVTGQTTIAASTATTSLPNGRIVTALFAGALFLSAFLLFVLEPMVAKSILPTLGGTPMAWNTRLRGTEVVDLDEAEAARDDRFTWALGKIGSLRRVCRPMSWSALSSLVAMPFGQLSPRKSESRACYLTNVAADKRSSGCAWLCHALLLTRLQLNFGVRQLAPEPTHATPSVFNQHHIGRVLRSS